MLLIVSCLHFLTGSLLKHLARVLTAITATTRGTTAASRATRASEPQLVDSLVCGGLKDAQLVAKNVLGIQKRSRLANVSATEHLNQLFQIMPKQWRLEVMDMTITDTILGEPRGRYAETCSCAHSKHMRELCWYNPYF